MGQIVDVSEALLELGLSSAVTEEERAITNMAIVKAEGSIRRYLGYNPRHVRHTEFYPRTDLDYQGRASVWEVEGSQAVLRRVAEAATNELQIQHSPIRGYPAIDLRIDYDGRGGARVGSFAIETQKTEGSDYWPNYDGVDSDGHSLCRDGIIRSAGSWPTTPGSVKIEYTAGFTAGELHGQDTVIDASPIVEAVIDETVRRVKKAFAQRKKVGAGFAAGPIISENLGDYSYSIDGAALSKLVGGTMDILPETREKLESFMLYGFVL